MCWLRIRQVFTSLAIFIAKPCHRILVLASHCDHQSKSMFHVYSAHPVGVRDALWRPLLIQTSMPVSGSPLLALSLVLLHGLPWVVHICAALIKPAQRALPVTSGLLVSSRAYPCWCSAWQSVTKDSLQIILTHRVKWIIKHLWSYKKVSWKMWNVLSV